MQRKQTSLTKCTRIERLAQLSEQEIVIERKKKEIQAKIDAQKKKETEEALKKLESANEIKNVAAPPSKMPLWRSFRHDARRDRDRDRGRDRERERERDRDRDRERDRERPKEKEKETETVVSEGPPKNAFSNDGSFLDQFKKLSSTGLKPDSVDVQTLAKARKWEDDERDRQKKFEKDDEKDQHWHKREQDRKQGNSRSKDFDNEEFLYRDGNRRSPIRKPLDSNIQLQLPPPGVVQLVPQHQVHIVPQVTSVVHQSVIASALPGVPPPNTPMPVMQPQVMSQVPPFRTNEIQLQAISSPSDYAETVQTVNDTSFAERSVAGGIPAPSLIPSQISISSIQPPLPIAPQNIPPPLPIQIQNIPPPPLPPKKVEESPKILIGNISMAVKSYRNKDNEGTAKGADISDIPTPPSTRPSISESKKKKKKRKNEEFSVAGCSPPPPGYFDAIPLPESTTSDNASKHSRVSPALSNEGTDADDLDGNDEDDDVDADDDDSDDKNAEGLDEGKYHLAKMVARCGDDVENLLRSRNQDDPALKFLFKKKSKKYRLYRRAVHKYRQNPELLVKEESVDNTDSEDEPPPKKEKSSIVKDEPLEESVQTGESVNKEGALDEGVFESKAKELSGFESALSSSSSSSSSRKENEVACKDSTTLEKSEERKRKRKSRWGDAAPAPAGSGSNEDSTTAVPASVAESSNKSGMLTQITRSDPGLLQYARQTFGSTNLSEEDWKKAEDHYKINLLYHDLCKKRAEIDKLQRAGKFKYEYDSDEDVEGGTWEHKLRQQEMVATQLWAEELTRQAAGKHHIGDFLPPEELERFLEKYNAVKEGREPDLSDYKEFKLKEDNVGYQLLQKMGWSEGQGLGQNGSGIVQPVSKATTRHENQGLGIDRPDGIEAGDDEYDAYRKRMMLAYRFRPNPLNNPRRPYY